MHKYTFIMIYIVISAVIGRSWLYVKLLAPTLLFLTLVPFYEAYRFVNGKPKVKYLEEVFLRNRPESYPCTTMLYVIYTRLVFDIAYKRVSCGSYFRRQAITILLIPKTIIYGFLGINGLFVVLVTTLLKLSKYRSLEDFLFEYASAPTSRKLVYRDGEWRHNPDPHKKAAEAAMSYFGHFTGTKRDLIYNYIYRRLVWEGIASKKCETVVATLSGDQSTKAHLILKGLSGSGNVALHVTDAAKAQKFGNYGHTVAINKAFLAKESTVLASDPSNHDLANGVAGTTPVLPYVLGAQLSGYSQAHVTQEFTDYTEYAREVGRPLSVAEELGFLKKEDAVVLEHICNGEYALSMGYWENQNG